MRQPRVVMFHPYVNRQAVANVVDTLTHQHEDGRLWIGEGPKVKQFEEALRDRFGFLYCVALNSGTAALRLALAMCDVGPGDEIITPAQTCTATNMPILEQFATPVFADIKYRTGNIDPTDIEHRITERTKAIIVVHWAGYPCDMDEINSIADWHHLWVIQDGAHALGATYKGRHIGRCSEFFMTSFQAIKQLTTGDGGLLAMTEEHQYHAARRRRWFGIDRENRQKQINGYAFWDQCEVGYKMHMNDIAASIGLGNLQDIDKLLAWRQFIVKRYRENLADVPGVTLFERRPDRESANWLFTMHVERRDDFCRMMRDKGVEASVVHIRNDAHTIFGPKRLDLPVTDRYAETNISIPLHNRLSLEDADYVIECIKGGW